MLLDHLIDVYKFLLVLCTGLLRLQDLVRAPPTSKMEVYIRQGTVNTYRQVLREIKQRDINNIIVDTRTEHVQTFFRAVSLPQCTRSCYTFYPTISPHNLLVLQT